MGRFLRGRDGIVSADRSGAVHNATMEPNLFKYILKYSRREQLAILAVVVVSLLFYYASLDLPKTIVNAITKLSAHSDRMTTFMHIELGLPGFLGGQSFVLFDGFRLDRPGYLVAICTL